MSFLKSASLIVLWLIIFYIIKSKDLIHAEFFVKNIEYIVVGLLVYVEVRLLMIRTHFENEKTND